MTDDKRAFYGDELYEALVQRSPVEPLTSREDDLTIEDAYHIQRRMVQRRLDAGDRVVGKKIGVTSKAVMSMLEVDQPDFGQLTAAMAFGEGQPVSLGPMIQPRAEAEIAFVLKADLEGPGITASDVLRATEYVVPCFEIVDSRIRNWQIRIQDTVADNASSAAFVLGGHATDVRAVDLALAGMVLEKNGEIVSVSAGAAALGSPVNCVVWLANTLGRLGMVLRASEVVLSGSLSPLIPVAPGDHMRVSVGGLGAAAVRFT